MENYKTATNYNLEKEKIAPDLSYPKETHWTYKEVGTRLESPRGLEGAAIPKYLEEAV
jgi:hypothetical protein